MKTERWEHIERLYHASLELRQESREAFLQEACAGDEALRREVAALVACDGKAASFIETPALEIAAKALAGDAQTADQTQAPNSIAAPRRIGPYQVLALLGKGGMGEVYLALDTRLGRRVAIKLLPAEFTAAAERVSRFAQEARAASAFNHPNIITIYEIDDIENTHYIVTEYVEGETLRRRLDAGPLNLQEALDFAIQIATALEAAHHAGIIHRDIKPGNVMVRPDGYIKVLDFGLAKLVEPSTASLDAERSMEAGVNTETGLVMGTPPCMSPEQARGEKVDARTDIFSLGIVLYEMVAGRAPFAGATTSEMIAAILRDEPAPLGECAPDAPPEMERILSKALRKNRDERYQTVNELLVDLKQLKRQLEQSAYTTAKRWAGGLRRRRLIAACALVVVVTGGGWLYWRNTKLNQAKAVLPRIEELAQAERFFEAYDLAIEAQRYLPSDPTLTRLMRTMADDLSVVTDPPGAEVYLKRFAPDEPGHFPARQLIGVTPISHRQIARGAYVVSIEKEGYAGLERTVTGLMLRSGGLLMPSPPVSLEAKMIETAKVPSRMAFVPGGDYRLWSWARPTDKSVRLDAFFIDKYEVTNREYKEFISAGGYMKREYWRHPIVKDRREIAWDDAIREFKDRTGLPGPRSWTNQDFPEGKAEHPVTDISWYEAAAYAAFRGKELPTVFQWEKAARNNGRMRGTVSYYTMPWGPFTGTIERRANFSGRGTLPVESLEFGQSPFGCYHMAGNVAEWCGNESPEGFTVTGGSWEDPPYLFGNYGAYPGSFTSGKLGFRCVLNAPGATGDQGAMPLLSEAQVPVYKPASEASFRAWQGYYRYAQPPLDAQIVDVKETEDWRREKITYVGAEGERAIAYLYLPKHYPPPWQVIQFMPGDAVFQGLTSIPVRVEASLAPFIKSGRAVLAVVLKGFPEREWPPNRIPPSEETIEYRDQVLNWTADQRRGLDYAVTRSDLDAGRVAYYVVSVGDSRKIVLPAVETRYRSVILIAAGLRQHDTRVLPEINPVNLLPQIRAPKLLLHGRYDETALLKSMAEPLQRLLRGPKRIVLYDGGHTPQPEISVPPINSWLDETMGPVRRQ